jgi:hypothetical protein
MWTRGFVLDLRDWLWGIRFRLKVGERNPSTKNKDSRRKLVALRGKRE